MLAELLLLSCGLPNDNSSKLAAVVVSVVVGKREVTEEVTHFVRLPLMPKTLSQSLVHVQTELCADVDRKVSSVKF